MNKKELATQVAKKTGLNQVEAIKCIDAVFQSIKDEVIAGNTTLLQGFGSFSVSKRAERRGINPSTRQTMIIPAHKVMKFTASKNVVIK